MFLKSTDSSSLHNSGSGRLKYCTSCGTHAAPGGANLLPPSNWDQESHTRNSPPCWARINDTDGSKKSCLTRCYHELRDPKVKDRLTRLLKQHQPKMPPSKDAMSSTPLDPQQKTRTCPPDHHGATANPLPLTHERQPELQQLFASPDHKDLALGDTDWPRTTRREAPHPPGSAPVKPHRQPRQPCPETRGCVCHSPSAPTTNHLPCRPLQSERRPKPPRAGLLNCGQPVKLQPAQGLRHCPGTHPPAAVSSSQVLVHGCSAPLIHAPRQVHLVSSS